MKAVHEKQNITPQQAVKVLRKNGIEATEEEAKKILDFLYLLAKLTINQYFNGKSRSH